MVRIIQQLFRIAPQTRFVATGPSCDKYDYAGGAFQAVHGAEAGGGFLFREKA